jgi:hypothetical protein
VKDGGTWCWGSNRNGGFGVEGPTESHQPVPVAVSGLPLGERDARFICYLEDGGVACPLGQVPGHSVVAGLETGVSALSGFCALKGDGIWCFNIEGLFEGDFASVTAASPLRGLETGVGALTSGCALKDGAVWCGLGNSGGSPGTQVPGLESGVTGLSSGDNDTCALKDGGVWCWGSNSHGQLGNNDPASSLVPVAVRFPPPSADTSAGSDPQPLPLPVSSGSSGHRTTYVLAATAAAALAIVVAAGLAIWRRRIT